MSNIQALQHEQAIARVRQHHPAARLNGVEGTPYRWRIVEAIDNFHSQHDRQRTRAISTIADTPEKAWAAAL